MKGVLLVHSAGAEAAVISAATDATTGCGLEQSGKHLEGNLSEIFVSVDVETSGPVPGEYSMLSLGACLVSDLSNSFYRELKPTGAKADRKSVKVSGLSLAELKVNGTDPEVAMSEFANWADGLLSEGDRLVFVGLNAPFDWSFVNYYFHRYLGRNPFGFTALDIKAYYMGATGCSWRETAGVTMAERLSPQRKGNHNALVDAQYQAELFTLLRVNKL